MCNFAEKYNHSKSEIAFHTSQKRRTFLTLQKYAKITEKIENNLFHVIEDFEKRSLTFRNSKKSSKKFKNIKISISKMYRKYYKIIINVIF